MDKQEYFRQYRENNLEKIKEYQQKYYLANKEKYNEKIECECGRYYDIKHKNRHLKTQIHLNNIKKTI
jgi:hypothetical protein